MEYVFTGYGCPDQLLPYDAPPGATVEDFDNRISGFGPTALAAIFKRIGDHGITAIRTMSEERFNKLFGRIKYDDFSVEQVINCLRFIRDPSIDIEAIHNETFKKSSQQWLAIVPDQLFNERFMKNFKGSEYFNVLASNPNATAYSIIDAWFSDLQNGLITANVKYVFRIINRDVGDVTDNERRYAFSKFIVENGLMEKMNSIPSSILVRAQLWILKTYIEG